MTLIIVGLALLLILFGSIPFTQDTETTLYPFNRKGGALFMLAGFAIIYWITNS